MPKETKKGAAESAPGSIAPSDIADISASQIVGEMAKTAPVTSISLESAVTVRLSVSGRADIHITSDTIDTAIVTTPEIAESLIASGLALKV